MPLATSVQDESIVGLDEDKKNADDEVVDKSEDEVDEDSRRNLIEPIVEQLDRQTRAGERARVANVVGAVREPGL